MARSEHKPVWDTKNPRRQRHRLTAAEKRSAKAAAKKAGRPYPNAVDNINAAKRSRARRRHSTK